MNKETIISVLQAIKTGYDYNPGDSDLDNEQPIHVSMTLGDYRKAWRLLHSISVAPATPQAAERGADNSQPGTSSREASPKGGAR